MPKKGKNAWKRLIQNPGNSFLASFCTRKSGWLVNKKMSKENVSTAKCTVLSMM